jgi:hypothetical protein
MDSSLIVVSTTAMTIMSRGRKDDDQVRRGSGIRDGLAAVTAIAGAGVTALADGYLLGWPVIDLDGNEVCADPYMSWSDYKIECGYIEESERERRKQRLEQ